MPRVEPPEGYLDRETVVTYLHQHGVNITESMMYRDAKKYGIKRTNHWYRVEDIDKYIEEKTGKPVKKKEKPATFEPANFVDMAHITEIAGKLFTSATITPIPAQTRQSWLFKEPRGHYVVRKKDGGVVAYLHIVAVREEWAERYIRGEVYGRNLTGDDIQRLEPGIPLTCIVISIGTDPGIASQSAKSRYVSVLLRGVKRELAQLGREGIIISRLYAFSETIDGRSLAARLGMQQATDPIGKRNNYVMNPLTAQVSFLKRYQENIKRYGEIAYGSERATIDERPPVIAGGVNMPPTSAKPTKTKRTQHEDTIPHGYISFKDMCLDHGVKETSAHHGVGQTFTVIHGQWYARGRIVKAILDRDRQFGFIAYVKTLPGYRQCENVDCPCHIR